MFVIRVFTVPIGRTSAVLTVLSFATEHIFHLPGAIPQVDLVHGKQEGGHNVLILGIEIVRNREIAYPVLWEILLGIVTGLPHITPEPD